MSLLKKWCQIHEFCDLEGAHGLLLIAGIPSEEAHLGGNIYGLQITGDLDHYGLVTRHGGNGYEVGWYCEVPEDAHEETLEEWGPLDGQTIAEVVTFLRQRLG